MPLRTILSRFLLAGLLALTAGNVVHAADPLIIPRPPEKASTPSGSFSEKIKTPAPNKKTAKPDTQNTLSPPAKEISISDALEMALRSNLNLAIERIDPLISRAAILQNRGSFDPTANFDIDYSERSQPRTAEQIAADGRRSSNFRTTRSTASVNTKTALGTTLTASTSASNGQSSFNEFDDEYTTDASISITQSLLKNFGPDINLANIRISQKQADSALDDFIYQAENLVRDVLLAYFELLHAQAQVEAVQQSLQLATRLLSDNQERLRIGVVSPLDVSQARSEVATRKTELLQARNTHYQNSNTLKRLITRNLSNWLHTRLLPIDTMPTPDDKPAKEVEIARALGFRRDYSSLKKLIEADDIDIVYSKNQLLPEIDLTGSYTQNGLSDALDQSYDNTFSGDDPEWLIGLSISIPWGNRTEKGQLEAAKLRKQQRILRIKNLEQTIINQIDNAVSDRDTAAARVSETRIARTFAEENLEAEQEKLKAGASTTYTVLQLQRDLAQSQTRELRALTDYNRARIELLHAQGILLQSFAIEVDTP